MLSTLGQVYFHQCNKKPAQAGSESRRFAAEGHILPLLEKRQTCATLMTQCYAPGRLWITFDRAKAEEQKPVQEKKVNTVRVCAIWDDEAKVWVAQSDDVPGLVAEAETVSELIEKLKIRVPEMLEENGVTDDADEIPFEFLTKRTVISGRAAH